MSEEQQYTLNFEGAVDVARWTCRAWESGHFDWNLLAGDDAAENIAERWKLVRWLNDEHHLDCLDIEDSEDREVCAAIMLAFVTTALHITSEREHVTPQDWIDIALTNAEGVEEMRLLALGGGS